MWPTFPEFIPLTLDDKEKYNALISDFPPFSDISFTNLHIWWSLDGTILISSLNQNLVIDYRLPFDPEASGYGLVGTHQVNESIGTIFAHLQHHRKPIRLVHVPEFVIEKIQDKSQFNIEEEPIWHEYIMSSRQLADLEGKSHSRTRRKVARFLRETKDKRLEVRTINLSSDQAKNEILKAILSWQDKYAQQNDPERVEDQALEKTIKHSEALGTQNLCLFIDSKLQGVVLFHPAVDKEHYIINHLKVDYSYPHIYDYLTNQLAVQATKCGVTYLNMEMDLGLEGLRKHKMGLRPVGFFKKFTIRPKV